MRTFLKPFSAFLFGVLTFSTAFAANPDFSSLGAVSDNAFDIAQARNGDTVTFTLTIAVAEDSDGVGVVTFDVGAAIGLTATFPAAGSSTTHTTTYAVLAGQDGPISVTGLTFINTGAETLVSTPGFPHTPTPNVTFDNTAPTVTENTAVVTPTNDSTPSVTINTDEAGTLTMGGSCGTSSSTTLGTGNTTIVLTQGDDITPLTTGAYADCTVQITDAAGNANVATALTAFTVDLIAPTVTENTAVVTPANDTTPDVTINTDEAGTLTMGGSCGTSSSTSLASGNTTITLTQADNTTPLTAGTYADCTVQITDASGNANVATALTSFLVDLTDPTVDSILRQASNPTNVDVLVWRVSFSEDVQNVDMTDFTVTGTTGTVVATNIVTPNSVFDVAASGGDLASLNGTVTLSFAGGQNIQDLAANSLTVTLPTITNDNTYIVDNIAPTVTETTAVSSPTMDVTPDMVINTDEVGTLTMGGSCGTSSSTTIGSTGDTTITLTQPDNSSALVDGVTYGDCTVQITDASGNANVATALTSFLVDAGDPTVDSILRQTPASSPTNADSLVWRVTFSEDVLNVDTTDFTITGTTATLAVAVVSASVYDVTANGGDLAALNATATLNFAGGQNITDLAANPLTVTLPTITNDNTYIVDNTAPTVTETTAVVTPGNDNTPDVIINTDEVGTLTMGGSCGTSTSTTIGSTGDQTITLTQPDNSTALADLTFADCTATVTDAAGNSSVSLAITSFQVDTIAPVITEITAVPNPTTDNTPDYVFNADEAGTIAYGGSCSSLTTAATATNNTVTFNALADATYADCTVTLGDAAGNNSNTLNLAAFRVDTVAPSVQSATVATSGNPGFARETQTVTFSVTFNEAVTVTAVNVASDGTATSNVTTEFDAAAAATDQLVFDIQAGDNGAVVPVVNFDIQDAAGLTTTINSLGAIVGTVVVADTTAPTLVPVSIASNNADPSLAITGNNVVVSFTGSETLLGVSGTVFTEVAATANPAGDDWTLTLMTSGDELEGLAPFTADFSDEAGNVGVQVVAVTDASSVTYDNTPAAVSSVTVVSNNLTLVDAPTYYARATQTITVTIDPTEAIQTPVGTILGLAPVFTNTVGDIWTATVTTLGGEAEGTVPFSIDVQDLAGAGIPITVSATTNGSSVIYDTTAPTNPGTTLDVEGVPIAGSKPTTSAIFNWTGDADVLSGVFDFLVRFENPTVAINQSATVVLPTRSFTPAAVVPSANPYNFYISARDKAGNEAVETLVYTQRYSGLLTGTILDENGAPLEGVVVNVIAKHDEQCGVSQNVCSAVTNAAGHYEVPIIPNQTYLVDFIKMPRYEIKKQYLTAGAGDLVLDGQMTAVADGFTQTGNQSRNFTLNYEGRVLTITVHSFSGQANVSQTSEGVELESFGLITLIESDIEEVEIINLGNNRYRVNGAFIKGPVTGVTPPNKGLKKVLGSSSGGGFSGMTRAQNATKGRILTPAESKAFIKELNEGAAGQTLYYLNSNGKKVFAGYINGRLSMVVFNKNARTPIVYRGYRRTRQTYGEDQANVNKNQIALNQAINKNKMLQKEKVKSVSIGNRYESLRRKMTARGQVLKPLVNRKQTTSDMIRSLKNRNQFVAAKQYEFARSNGFTHTESRISQNRQAKQSEKLKIIQSKEGVAKIFREMKKERMEAFSFQGRSK